jgi:LysM repeat protein
VLVALLTVLAGCGGGSADPPRSTVAQTSTTYATIPARATTTTVAPPPEDTSASGDDGGDEPESSAADDPNQERIHEIESGDFLYGIARDYGVAVNDIAAYNGWDDGLGHALVPGETIRIPPADWTPDGEGGDDTAAGSDGSDPESSSDEGCGTYTIKAGDTPARVASIHDVSVAELDAANAGTPFYAGFVVGIDIVIPC